MPVRTIDRPNWLAPSPTRVCVSAVDHAPPQIETAAPNPSIVWYLVAVFTTMSAVAGGPVVGTLVVGGAEVGGAEVGTPVVVGAAVVGAPVGDTGPPVQATPFTVKLVGAGLLPVHEPLKPNDAVPLVA